MEILHQVRHPAFQGVLIKYSQVLLEGVAILEVLQSCLIPAQALKISGGLDV
jgi:hypothetical protein